MYINFLSVDISTIFTRKDSCSTMVFYIIGTYMKKKRAITDVFQNVTSERIRSGEGLNSKNISQPNSTPLKML